MDVKEDNKEYKKIDMDKAISKIIERMKNKRPVFFTGAGISASAGIPLWNEIKKDLYKDLFNMDNSEEVEKILKDSDFNKKDWLEKNVLLKDERKCANGKDCADEIIKKIDEGELPPELLISFYKNKYGLLELQNFLARQFDRYKDSISYNALVELFRLNFYRFYLTANQDYVFERFLIKRFSPTKFLSLASQDDFKEAVSLFKSKPRLIEDNRLIIGNLHGVYYKPETLQISPKQLFSGFYKDSPYYQLLKIALESTDTLIIIGYRGVDSDISEALIDILKDKEDFQIIWVNKKCEVTQNDAPKIIKELNENTFLVDGLADEFLTRLKIKFEEKVNDNIKLVIRDIPDPSKSKETLIRVSAPGSVVISGDYSVYENGKMIQLQIPLRAYAVRFPKNPEDEDKAFYYDPYLGTWETDTRGLGYIKKAYEMIKAVIKGNWDEFTNRKYKKNRKVFSKEVDPIKKMLEDYNQNIKEFFPNAIKRFNNDYNNKDFIIHTYSQFPTGSGCGDTLPYVILGAMLLDPVDSSREIKLEQIQGDKRNMLINLSKLFAWLYTYPNTSHLRILPTFWNGCRVFILDRSKAQEKAFEKLNDNVEKDPNDPKFMQANLLIDTVSILKNGCNIKLDPHVIDFAVAYYPRRIILTDKILDHSDTRVGVFQLDYKRDKILLEVMAKFTEEIETLNKKNAKTTRVGKILSAYHFTLDSLGRGSRLVNQLVGALSGMRGVYGAKTSGSGPGGALVIAYNPVEIDLLKMLSVVENYQHRILCYNILSDEKNACSEIDQNTEAKNC